AELRPAGARGGQTLVHHHYVARAVGVGEIADEDVAAFEGTDEAVRGRTVAAARDCAEVIGIVALQLQQCGRELEDLVVHILHKLPRGGFVSELIHGRVAVAADGWSKIGEVRKPAPAASERAVSLQ